MVIPLEIGWAISVQWYAGNASCKLLMFIRALAFYLSSMLLVSLTLDRFLAIARPLASLKSRKYHVNYVYIIKTLLYGKNIRTIMIKLKLYTIDVTKRRCHIMIGTAWLSAAMFAFPQTIVFRELSHPNDPSFKQCTTIGFFNELLQRTPSNNNDTSSDSTSAHNESTKQYNTSDPEQLYIMSPDIAENLYSSLFLFAVYILPLSVIIVTYANILNKLYRRSGINKQFPEDHNHHNNIAHTNAASENERPPTYLIRCLSYFRSAVRQERLQRENVSEHIKGRSERRSFKSFDTVTTFSDRAGENPRTLLSTDASCNKSGVEEHEPGSNNPQRQKTKLNEHNGKRRTSFELSYLQKEESVSAKQEEQNKIRRSSNISLSPDLTSNLRGSSTSTVVKRGQSVRCGASKASSSNIVALRMCAIQVLAFIICWTPFVCISLWHIIGKFRL